MEMAIVNAQKNVIENATKLIIDEKAFHRLREDILGLVITDDRKQINNIVATSLNNSNVKRSTKNRQGLFDQPNNLPPK